LTTAVEKCRLEPKVIGDVFVNARRLLSMFKVFPQDPEDILGHTVSVTSAIATLECLIACWEKKPDVCLDLEVTIGHTKKWIVQCDLLFQNSTVMKLSLEVIPTITHFVFLIYVDRPAVKMDQAFVEAIFDFMPWPPEVECQKDVLAILAKAMVMPQLAIPWLKIRICAVFAELLVLPPDELCKFGFEPTLLKKMKFVLGKTLEKEPDVVAAVSERLTNPSDRPLLLQLLREK
jgi:hypothetical protein